MSARSEALAQRLENGARQLAEFAKSVSDAEWTTPIPGDGRTVGVLVHHVANMYPIEIQLAQALGGGNAIEGVTWGAVHEINAKHAVEKKTVTKAEAIEALMTASAVAATAVRAFSDAQLDSAAAVSLNSDAPLTCQFFIEDHAMRHSYHHLAKIRAALGK